MEKNYGYVNAWSGLNTGVFCMYDGSFRADLQCRKIVRDLSKLLQKGVTPQMMVHEIYEREGLHGACLHRAEPGDEEYFAESISYHIFARQKWQNFT